MASGDSEQRTAKRKEAASWLKGNPDQLIRAANRFVRGRIEQLGKDLAICLCPTVQMNHGSDRPFLETRAANFPALMYCVSFLELLSCLYAGSMRGNDANSAPCKVKRYAESFMGYTEETVQELALLFAMFRNKVAHATQPQGVFDPPTEWVPKQWRNETEWKRVTWTVSPGLRPVAITLGREDGTVDAPPWPLKYEYRCTVSLPLLAHQIIASALGENGYLQSLPGDSDARGNFADCMGDLFPPGADWMPPS